MFAAAGLLRVEHGRHPLADGCERMNGMDVWLVENGDHEQRGVVAVFATEALAVAYCATHYPDETPTAFRLWDRAPTDFQWYEQTAVFPLPGCVIQAPTSWSPCWEEADGGYRKNQSWPSDEVHQNHPVEETVGWWDGRKQTAVYVQVGGVDEAQVAARFAELWDEATAGRLGP